MIWCLLKHIHRRYFSSLELSNMKNDQEAFYVVCNSFLQFTALKLNLENSFLPYILCTHQGKVLEG